MSGTEHGNLDGRISFRQRDVQILRKCHDGVFSNVIARVALMSASTTFMPS